MKRMSITLELDAEEVGYLKLLAGPVGHDASTDVEVIVAGVVHHLVHSAVDGMRRPGSWERGWVAQAFGDDFTMELVTDPKIETHDIPIDAPCAAQHFSGLQCDVTPALCDARGETFESHDHGANAPDGTRYAWFEPWRALWTGCDIEEDDETDAEPAEPFEHWRPEQFGPLEPRRLPELFVITYPDGRTVRRPYDHAELAAAWEQKLKTQRIQAPPVVIASWLRAWFEQRAAYAFAAGRGDPNPPAFPDDIALDLAFTTASAAAEITQPVTT
jgi:hypothetical protein